MNAKDRFVGLPASFVALHVRQVAVPDSPCEGRSGAQLGSALMWVIVPDQRVRNDCLPFAPRC